MNSKKIGRAIFLENICNRMRVSAPSGTPLPSIGMAQRIIRQISARPEIVSVWTLTGDSAYLLRLYCRDLAALNRLVHQVLLPLSRKRPTPT